MTPVAVRLPWGPLHLARANGRGYWTACSRTVLHEDIVVAQGRAADRAWRHELQCQDCASVARRGVRLVAQRLGW